MKIKNLSINKIIDIINNMTYSKVKHTKDYATYPLAVNLMSSKDTHDTWEYQVFFETHLFNPEWEIRSVKLALFEPEYNQYSQDKFIYLSISKSKAQLIYIENHKATIIKTFNRDVNKLKKFLKTKMKEETIKAQKRKSHSKKKENSEKKNYINNLEMAY